LFASLKTFLNNQTNADHCDNNSITEVNGYTEHQVNGALTNSDLYEKTCVTIPKPAANSEITDRTYLDQTKNTNKDLDKAKDSAIDLGSYNNSEVSESQSSSKMSSSMSGLDSTNPSTAGGEGDNQSGASIRFSVPPLSESTLTVPLLPPNFLQIVYLTDQKLVNNIFFL